MNDQRVTIAAAREQLERYAAAGNGLTFDSHRQAFFGTDRDGATWSLALPLVCPPLNFDSAEDARAAFVSHRLRAIVVLIQAGYAALGYCEGESLLQHKMIKKYMVRQSQGKSQLSYKKTKGKSRLGSRIRLQNSVAFFEEINRALTEWRVVSRCDSILIALPVALTHPFYSADVPPPFEKKDPRIRKIPLNVRRPSFKELRHIHWEVTHGRLSRPGLSD